MAVAADEEEANPDDANEETAAEAANAGADEAEAADDGSVPLERPTGLGWLAMSLLALIGTEVDIDDGDD